MGAEVVRQAEKNLALCLEEGPEQVRTAGGFSASLIFPVLALIPASRILMDEE